MAAVFDKKLLSGYLIALKLRETVEHGLRKNSASNASTELKDYHHHQQPRDHQVHKLQREPSKGKNVPGDTLRPSEPEWVVYIKSLAQFRQEDVECSGANSSISRIPNYLKDGDVNAWIPQIVSLGPYHHGKRRLRNMEEHKGRCLRRILERSSQPRDLYLNSVKKVEKRARACYEGMIPFESEVFVEMMVLDGCFVIEMLLGFVMGFEALGYRRDDSVFSMGTLMHKIQRDMIMLENQIPLFLLDRLLGLQLNNPDQKGLAAKLLLQFFVPTLQTKLSRLEFDPLSDQCRLHCLEVFRWSLLHMGPKQAGNQRLLPGRQAGNQRLLPGRQQLINGVRELWAAGIKFRKRKTDRFWDIQFKDGVLHIPQLVIHDGTRSLFLNLIAFEQCHFDCGNHITSYAIFMDNLINSPEDVNHLRSRGIIEHWLGSDADVANLFNRLSQGVAFNINDSYLRGLSVEVNEYSNNRWNGWMASLKHKYFSGPWAIISLIAAVVLLMLTSAQTVYAVLSFHKPRS